MTPQVIPVKQKLQDSMDGLLFSRDQTGKRLTFQTRYTDRDCHKIKIEHDIIEKPVKTGSCPAGW